MSYGKIFPLGASGGIVNTGVLQLQGGVPLDSNLRLVTDQINTTTRLLLSTTSVTNYGGGSVLTNTAFGTDSLLSNTSGSNNVAYGYRSLRANTTGTQNVAVGVDALLSNTTGGFNTAVGYQALTANTTGGSNVAIGRDAMLVNNTGSDNIAIGRNSLYSNISGINNTALGHSALFSNTASNNVAVGKEAAFTNTSGTGITAIGYQALRASTGNNNTALGFQSGLGVTSGTNNTLLGYSAGSSLTTGVLNVMIGSGISTASISTNNVGIGADVNCSGSSNTVLGYIASTGGFAGSVILGRAATATANNQFVVGSAGTNAGLVATETNTTISSWAVKINGTDRKLLLLDTAQNVINVKQTIAASTTTTTVSWPNGNLADITLTSNTTLTLSTPVIGTYIIKLNQGGAGGFVVTWPASVKWSGGIAPVLTTTVGKTDVITLVWDGSTYYASYALNF